MGAPIIIVDLYRVRFFVSPRFFCLERAMVPASAGVTSLFLSLSRPWEVPGFEGGTVTEVQQHRERRNGKRNVASTAG